MKLRLVGGEAGGYAQGRTFGLEDTRTEKGKGGAGRPVAVSRGAQQIHQGACKPEGAWSSSGGALCSCC